MSDTLLTSVRRIGTPGLSLLRPQRSLWRAALFALAVTAGVTGLKPAALAQVVGEFEIDGNTVDNSGLNAAPYDWQDANVANGFGRSDFTDPPAGVDTTFTKGSKEDDPNGWNFETPPLSGSEPGKSDILSGGIAFRVVNVLGVPQQFMFVNFTVAAGTGAVHIDYEFNQSANTVINGAGFAIPARTSGDIVISFNQGGNNQLIPQVFQWNGTALAGTFTDITPNFTASDFLSALSLDTLFGEAGINFSKITSNALCGVNSFKKVWAKTRSAEQFTAVLKDRTLQSDVLICDDGNACTDDQCDINSPSTGYCSHTPITCNDGITCTNDTCNPATGCVFTPDNGACDDGNGCTTDTCSATGGCSHTANVGQACGDPSSGICDSADTCDANGICQPNHASTTTQCRASTGACDLPEFCNANGTCPVNAFQPPGTACGDPSSGVCDSADTCDGAGTCLQNHAPPTTQCRASAGACDVPEFCNPDGTCPANGFQPPGTACGDPSSSVCDNPDSCDGSGTCLVNHEPITKVCRPVAGDCDVPESCTANGTCPADGFKPSTVECRAATGECDLAENCTGSTATCPADAVKGSGTGCTPDDRNCTLDQCDGTSKTCTHPDTNVCAAPTLVKSVRNVTKGTDTFTTDTDADPGNTVEFQLVFTAGQDQADNNTVITDPVPDHCNYVADSCSDGNPNNNPDCTTAVANGVTTITFDAINVPASTSITLTFQCTIDNPLADGTKVTNVATSDFDDNTQTPPTSNDSTVTVHSECVTNADCVTTNPCAQNLCVTGHCQFPAGHAGATCRAAADVCDVAEVCTGSSTECPVDGFAPSTQLCRGAAGVCDIGDFCTGSGAACPADAKSTEVCRPSAGVCDVPESCDGVNNDCPADTFAQPGTACGDPSSGACDSPDTCDGSGSCQPNHATTTTECRPAAGACDVAEFCNADGTCPANGFQPPGAACGDQTTSVCDNPDSCDGSGTCLVNHEPITKVCRAVAGECDVPESCSADGTCPADGFKPNSVECRAATGECDLAEKCTGSSATCPADAVKGSGTGCTPDDRNCTLDQCDGTSKTCTHPDTNVCAAPTLVKSVRNVTKGTDTFTTDTDADPGNTVEFQLVFTAGQDQADNNTVITDPVPDHCNYVADSCSDGNPNNNPDCTTAIANGVTTITFDAINVPASTSITLTFQCTIDNPLADGTKVTNVATSDFDDNTQTPPTSNDSTVTVHSECVTNADCVTTNPCAQNLCVTGHCQFPAGHAGATCRAAADVCDVAEVCTGSSTDCPVDGFAPSTQLCRGAAGVCDIDDFCTGSGGACPADAKSTEVCRPSAGVCDVPESCDGVNNDCPADTFAPSTQLCRGAAGVCDVDDFCSGSSADCSADAKKPDGTSCADTDKCNGDEVCGAGTCQPGQPPVCNSNNVCITDSCDPATGCVKTNNSNSCDDGNFCNGPDTCADGSCSVHAGDPCVNSDPFECTIDTCVGNACVHTPEDGICDDNNDCTLDKCVGAGGDEIGCDHKANTVSTADSRAYGASVDLGGSQVIAPTPDSDKKNPDDLLAVPVPGVVDVRVLHVEESQSSDANGAAASAEASTAKVRLIQQALGSLVSVDAIQAIVTCNADENTAECSSAGSTLTNVKLNGDQLGDVTEPKDIKIDLPGLLVAHVQLLEQIGRGANAGVPQPANQKFSSGLTINAIHVTVTLGNKVLTDVIVGHAQADVSFGNGNTCEVGPRVSGRAYIVGREKPQDILTKAQIGEVNLPPTGGDENANLGDIGPLGDGSNVVAQSRTAKSHTDGAVDSEANTTSSNSYAYIEDLDILDTGTDPTHPLIGADLVRSECSASANSQGATSSGKSKLVGLTIGGQDVCLALGLGTTCEPAPNTPFPLPVPGTTIILNEQYCDGQKPTPNVAPSCDAANSSGITVNAVHITIDGLDAIGLGEIILSSSHCDVATTTTP